MNEESGGVVRDTGKNDKTISRDKEVSPMLRSTWQKEKSGFVYVPSEDKYVKKKLEVYEEDFQEFEVGCNGSDRENEVNDDTYYDKLISRKYGSMEHEKKLWDTPILKP